MRRRWARVGHYVGPAAAILVAACSSSLIDATTEVTTTTGALIVTVNGLPPAASGLVTVAGPNFSMAVPATNTLTSLTPGTYAITVDSVIVPQTFAGIPGVTPSESAPVLYRPTIVGTRVSVDSVGATVVPVIADSITAATINYLSPPPPVVTMSISNTVAMAGQHLLLSWTSSGASTCWGQGDGPWSTAPTIATSGTQSIAATVGGNSLSYFSVTCVGQGGGSMDDRTVLEQSNSISGTGDLAVFSFGLPGGVSAASSIAVVGQSTPASGVWTGLAPGTYTVTASSVTANGITYTPTPSLQTVHVSADSESAPTVTYTSPSSSRIRTP